MEYVKPDEGVILDLTEFEFEEDILAEIKKVFIGKVSTYNFLFRNTLSGADQVSLIEDRIRNLNEDSFINWVLNSTSSVHGLS